jgi:hypothetical protein
MDHTKIKTILHKFTMGDVEDPYLYAAFPISEWQKTEKGQWCMTHSGIDPSFVCRQSLESWGYEVSIHGSLSPADYTYFQLRWGNYDKADT